MKETAAVLIDGPRRPAVSFAAAAELERPPAKNAATGERALSNPPQERPSSPS